MDINAIGISYLLISIIIILYCTAQILRRAGFSPIWSPLVLIPFIDIVIIWVFAYSIWPSHDSYRNVELVSSKRRIILVSSIVIAILLAIFAGGAHFVIPSYVKLFNSFSTELPLITKMVLASYKYLVVMPLLGCIACVDMLFRQQWSVQYQYYMFGSLLGMLIIAFALIPLAIWAMYAPIFQMSTVN